jgi:hypothetical protein
LKKDDSRQDNRIVSYESGNRNKPTLRRLKKNKKIGEKKNEQKDSLSSYSVDCLDIDDVQRIFN